MPLSTYEFKTFELLLEQYIKENNNILPELNQNQEYVINVKNTNKTKVPSFTAISGGKFMKPNKEGLLQEVGKLNKRERWFFLLIDRLMDFDTNTAFIKNSSLTTTEQQNKSRAYKSLHKLGLVKRVKREYYIINPDKIIPLNSYPIVKKIWNSLP